MSITCGIDWAEAHHDVALIDEHGVVVARSRIDTGAAGFSALLALIAEHGGGVDDTPVAVETDKNLIVVALVEAGFTVYPINPRGVARYRERYGQAGGKSDPGDATVLAHVLRTDRHMHRRLPANTSQASAIKVLARQHQEAIWALHQTVSRLRSVLLEFYPQALQAFPNLQHHAATTVLAAVPTPAAAGKLTRTRVATLLRRSGRGNHPVLAERILTELRVPTLRQPRCVEEAYGHTVQGLVGAVVAMRTATDELEKALACEFDQHPLSDLLRSVPGLGPVLAARILAEIGDDSARFDNPPKPARIRGHGTGHHRLRAFALRQGTQSPQQAPRRRLPLVGLHHPDQISRRACPLRQPPSGRGPPQRCTPKPREQTHRPPLVVPGQQPTMGRAGRLAPHDQHRQGHRCLTLTGVGCLLRGQVPRSVAAGPP